jgi:hypothetical protein
MILDYVLSFLACPMTSSLSCMSHQGASVCKQPGDEKLGFDGCVASLGKCFFYTC